MVILEMIRIMFKDSLKLEKFHKMDIMAKNVYVNGL